MKFLANYLMGVHWFPQVSVELQIFINYFLSTYLVEEMNKKRNKIGHLFQGRYKAILVDADNYLLQLVQYIHLNPVRAKIVKHPEDYLWSSHTTYLQLNFFEWLTTNYV